MADTHADRGLGEAPANLFGGAVSQRRVPEVGPGKDWRSAAACQDADPDLFFPVSRSGQLLRQAKAICAGCPVWRPCLSYALRTGQVGIWGGLTEEERRRLPRRGRNHALRVVAGRRARPLAARRSA